MAAIAAPTGGVFDSRSEMVKRIFQHFDVDGDGVLDRQEMAALVVALNPSIKFTKTQLDEIVDTVFQFYSKAARVTFGALLCIYDEIGGDVYRDFDALFLGHLSRPIAAPSTQEEDEVEEEGDMDDFLFSILDRLPSRDSSETSSSFPPELVSSDDDCTAYAPMSELEEIFSFGWPSPHSPQASDALEGEQGAHQLDRVPSVDVELDLSHSDGERCARLVGDEELPSFRWWITSTPSPSGQLRGYHERVEKRKRERGESSWAGIRKLTFNGFGVLRWKNRQRLSWAKQRPVDAHGS